jgi:hypothetical protein
MNAVMTATYWEIGHRIVEIEQRGSAQAEYGNELIKRLAGDLTTRSEGALDGETSIGCETSIWPTPRHCQHRRQYLALKKAVKE